MGVLWDTDPCCCMAVSSSMGQYFTMASDGTTDYSHQVVPLHDNHLERTADKPVMRSQHRGTCQSVMDGSPCCTSCLSSWEDTALGVTVTHRVVGFLKGGRHRPAGTYLALLIANVIYCFPRSENTTAFVSSSIFMVHKCSASFVFHFSTTCLLPSFSPLLRHLLVS